MDQDSTWYGGRLRPIRRHCVRWGSRSPMERGTAAPTFRLMSSCGKRSPVLATAEPLFLSSMSYGGFGSAVVRAFDSRLDGREFDSRPPRLMLRWVTVFSISPSDLGQLSLLPSAGREMSTNQSAVTLCDWGVKGRYGSFHLLINVWVAGKTV